jgi:hypothetical protein
MIEKKENKINREVSGLSNEMDWSVLENLARRVIRAANLAVMTHAELDVFTQKRTHGRTSGKKAG